MVKNYRPSDPFVVFLLICLLVTISSSLSVSLTNAEGLDDQHNNESIIKSDKIEVIDLQRLLERLDLMQTKQYGNTADDPIEAEYIQISNNYLDETTIQDSTSFYPTTTEDISSSAVPGRGRLFAGAGRVG